jgi:hypothetical protein
LVDAEELVLPITLIPTLLVPVAAEISVGKSVLAVAGGVEAVYVADPESVAESLSDDEPELPDGDVPSGQMLVELLGS